MGVSSPLKRRSLHEYRWKTINNTKTNSLMKILVCISNVPDTTTKITFTDNNTQFNTNGVQFILNPYDEIALSRAIELTEGGKGSVTVINVGEVNTESTILRALAIGAD